MRREDGPNDLLIAVTKKRTKQEIDALVDALERVSEGGDEQREVKPALFVVAGFPPIPTTIVGHDHGDELTVPRVVVMMCFVSGVSMANHVAFPKYEAPPLVEVAMSVQFDPINGLSNAHLGAFWSRHAETYPAVRTTQPIAPSPDDVSKEGQWIPPSLRLTFSPESDCRVQMWTQDEQWMWQVQSDRIVVNWRRRAKEYPHFAATLDRFKTAWSAWHEFLTSHQLSMPSLRRWELTYVNRVPQGEGDLWHSPSDWPGVLPGLWKDSWRAAEGLSLRGLRSQWVWHHEEPPARLIVESRPAQSTEEPPVDILMLNLTARGPISINAVAASSNNNKPEDAEAPIEAGMNLGHRLIVFTFDSLGSDLAKKYWQRDDHT